MILQNLCEISGGYKLWSHTIWHQTEGTVLTEMTRSWNTFVLLLEKLKR